MSMQTYRVRIRQPGKNAEHVTMVEAAGTYAAAREAMEARVSKWQADCVGPPSLEWHLFVEIREDGTYVRKGRFHVSLRITVGDVLGVVRRPTEGREL